MIVNPYITQIMKTKKLSLFLFSLLFSSFTFVSCSSDSSGMDDDSGNVNSSPSSGVIPENSDSGKNNSSEPDNVSGSSGDQNNNEGDDSNSSSSSWQLVFEDNFEDTDSIPDTSKWSLAPKGDDTWNRHMSESYGQAYQKNGYLYLFGMMVDDEYLTGGIETRNKYDFTYGQVKCRARFLRQPQGNHTGIWMMPEPPAEKWPRSGEIDIMEHLNDEDIVYETVHNWWADGLDHADDPKNRSTASIDNDEFNVYGIIWTQDSITFTVNGKVSFTYKNEKLEGDDGFYQWPFTKPFYLILSQSLGGADTWEGAIDNDELPAIFQIDWIKVWQKTE